MTFIIGVRGLQIIFPTKHNSEKIASQDASRQQLCTLIRTIGVGLLKRPRAAGTLAIYIYIDTSIDR